MNVRITFEFHDVDLDRDEDGDDGPSPEALMERLADLGRAYEVFMRLKTNDLIHVGRDLLRHLGVTVDGRPRRDRDPQAQVRAAQAPRRVDVRVARGRPQAEAPRGA